MNIIVEDLAKKNLEDLYYYNLQFSSINAEETDLDIYALIYDLEDSPYIGRYVKDISDKHFRELVYRKNRNTSYRILYYISEKTKTIYILHVSNFKQNFKRILKRYNYFKNYYEL